MAAGISTLSDHPTPRWKLIFYILGSVTCVLGIALYFFLADGPASAKWIKAEDRPLAVNRVAQSGVGLKTTNFNWKHGLEAFVDPKKCVGPRRSRFPLTTAIFCPSPCSARPCPTAC